MKLENVKNLGILAALAAGAYAAYSLLGKANTVLTTTGEAIGSGLFDLFNPDPLGETLYYTATFPDGVKHSVPSRSVNASGIFTNKNLSPQYTGDGRSYRLVKNKSTGYWFAVAP